MSSTSHYTWIPYIKHKHIMLWSLRVQGFRFGGDGGGGEGRGGAHLNN